MDEPMTSERLNWLREYAPPDHRAVRELVAEVDRLRAQIMSMKSLPLTAAAMGAVQERSNEGFRVAAAIGFAKDAENEACAKYLDGLAADLRKRPDMNAVFVVEGAAATIRARRSVEITVSRLSVPAETGETAGLFGEG